MPQNQGVLLPGAIRPFDSNDTYPIAYNDEIAGSTRLVETLELRDLIPNARRTHNQLVFVTNSNPTDTLNRGIFSWNATTQTWDDFLPPLRSLFFNNTNFKFPSPILELSSITIENEGLGINLSQLNSSTTQLLLPFVFIGGNPVVAPEAYARVTTVLDSISLTSLSSNRPTIPAGEYDLSINLNRGPIIFVYDSPSLKLQLAPTIGYSSFSSSSNTVGIIRIVIDDSNNITSASIIFPGNNFPARNQQPNFQISYRLSVIRNNTLLTFADFNIDFKSGVVSDILITNKGFSFSSEPTVSLSGIDSAIIYPSFTYKFFNLNTDRFSNYKFTLSNTTGNEVEIAIVPDIIVLPSNLNSPTFVPYTTNNAGNLSLANTNLSYDSSSKSHNYLFDNNGYWNVSRIGNTFPTVPSSVDNNFVGFTISGSYFSNEINFWNRGYYTHGSFTGGFRFNQLSRIEPFETLLFIRGDGVLSLPTKCIITNSDFPVYSDLYDDFYTNDLGLYSRSSVRLTGKEIKFFTNYSDGIQESSIPNILISNDLYINNIADVILNNRGDIIISNFKYTFHDPPPASLPSFSIDFSSGRFNVIVNNPGSGFIRPPIIKISSRTGSGARVYCVLNSTGGIQSVEVLDYGSNYRTNDTIEAIPANNYSSTYKPLITLRELLFFPFPNLTYYVVESIPVTIYRQIVYRLSIGIPSGSTIIYEIGTSTLDTRNPDLSSTSTSNNYITIPTNNIRSVFVKYRYKVSDLEYSRIYTASFNIVDNPIYSVNVFVESITNITQSSFTLVTRRANYYFYNNVNLYAEFAYDSEFNNLALAVFIASMGDERSDLGPISYIDMTYTSNINLPDGIYYLRYVGKTSFGNLRTISSTVYVINKNVSLSSIETYINSKFKPILLTITNRGISTSSSLISASYRNDKTFQLLLNTQPFTINKPLSPFRLFDINVPNGIDLRPANPGNLDNRTYPFSVYFPVSIEFTSSNRNISSSDFNPNLEFRFISPNSIEVYFVVSELTDSSAWTSVTLKINTVINYITG